MNNNKCGFGIASLVVGIASATILFIGGSVLGLLGLIFGIVALRRKECNKGFAIGGIVTSCIGMIFGILVIIGCVFYQDEIQEWLDAAQKEADYADSRLTSLYSAGIGKFDQYMEKLNVAYTEVGARGDQLKMTESRMSNQQLTVEQLKSDNEDRDISDIIIDYTAAYNAYQASLLASSKIEKQTLLNYI